MDAPYGAPLMPDVIRFDFLEKLMRFISSLIIIILFLPTSSYAQKVLNLGSSGSQTTTISEQVLIEAYKRINIKVNIIKLPAERSLLNANNGLLDGEVNRIMGINKKYTNLIRVPIPVNYFEAVAFSKNHNFTVNGWDSLKPYTIAIRLGIKFAEDGTKGMNVKKFVSNEKLFLLVSKNRYDVCVSTRIIGLYQIKKHKLIGVKALEPPLARYELYHYLHNKHKNIIPKISAELLEMEQEGLILKIREIFIKEMLKPDKKIDQKNSADPKSQTSD